MQPVYILLDTSGSMRGEPIAAVNVGLSSMLSAIQSRPGLGQRVQVCLQTFDAQVHELVPLQSVSGITLPALSVPGSGPTFLGEALEVFIHTYAQQPRDAETLPAMLFVMTDGSPTDLQVFEEAIPKVRALGLSRIVAFAAGPKAKVDPLRPLADELVTLDTLDICAFSRMFDHIAQVIGGGTAATSLVPPPPDEIKVEF